MYYKQRPAAAAGGLTVWLSILNVSGDATVHFLVVLLRCGVCIDSFNAAGFNCCATHTNTYTRTCSHAHRHMHTPHTRAQHHTFTHSFAQHSQPTATTQPHAPSAHTMELYSGNSLV